MNGGGKLAAFTVYYLVFNTGNLSWRIMDKVIKFLFSRSLLFTLSLSLLNSP